MAGEYFVCLRDAAGDLVSREITVEKIRHAQAAAIHLVGIGRADSALGGSDFLIAEGGLAGGVEFLVDGEHHVGAI